MSLPIVLRAIAVVVGFPLLTFSFGWAVLCRREDLDAEERLAASWGVGFAVMAASQLAVFAVGADLVLSNLVVLSILTVFSVVRLRAGWRREARGPGYWGLVGTWSLGYLCLAGIQAVLPIYAGAGWHADWWMHEDVALVFLGDRSVRTVWFVNTLASRNPLYNLAGAFVMSLAGHEFWVFQLATVLLSYAVALAAYILMRDLFGPRIARLSLFLMPLNLWMMHIAWFTWPKMLTAYYLFLGLHFYLRFLRLQREDPDAAARMLTFSWVLLMLAFVTHQLAAPYVIAMVLHALMMAARDRAYWPGIRRIAILGILAVLIVAPWYVYLVSLFGAGRLVTSSPVVTMDPNAPMGLRGLLGSIVYHTWRTLVPVRLLEVVAHGPRTFGEFYRFATAFYFMSVIGCLTVSLTGFLVSRIGRIRSAIVPDGRTAEWLAVWMFTLLGVLGTSALHPQRQPAGIAHAAYAPSVILLTMLAWGVLARASRAVFLVTCGGIVAEFLVMLWSHLYFVTRGLGLEGIRAELDLKEANHLVFFLDIFRDARKGMLVCLALLQVALLVGLARWLRRGRRTDVGTPADPTDSAEAPA